MAHDSGLNVLNFEKFMLEVRPCQVAKSQEIRAPFHEALSHSWQDGMRATQKQTHISTIVVEREKIELND